MENQFIDDMAASIGGVDEMVVSIYGMPQNSKRVSWAPENYGQVVVTGVEVLLLLACLFIDLVQLLYELKKKRVFTLTGAQGVESIRCDHDMRALLQQRSQPVHE